MGKHDPDIVRLAGEHVFQLFRDAKADNPLVYHDFKRARELVVACKEIAKVSKLDDGDLELLLLAAWFHDAGYAATLDGDRRKSVELARTFLARHGQPAALVKSVTAALEAADGDRPSDGAVHEVLHDALLLPLASKNYVAEAELLRLEWERRSGKIYTDLEWTQGCIAYFDNHPFRTRYAQLEYNGRRAANLVRLHKLLRKQEADAAEEEAEEAKITKGVGRTVGDIFYYLTRIQVRLLAIADRRTSTMVHVNAIMISLVIALLLRRAETHRHWLLPTLVLLIVNLAVIFTSIYSMRLGRPTLRRILGEDAPAHDANLLMFSNDVRISRQDYVERMSRLAQDVPALQRTMIEDLYLTRKLLLSRARALRITYDIFIYGLALSVLVFAIALLRR